MHVCMYVCMYVRTYVCVYVCMYVRMYVCMYKTIHICDCQWVYLIWYDLHIVAKRIWNKDTEERAEEVTGTVGSARWILVRLIFCTNSWGNRATSGFCGWVHGVTKQPKPQKACMILLLGAQGFSYVVRSKLHPPLKQEGSLLAMWNVHVKPCIYIYPLVSL